MHPPQDFAPTKHLFEIFKSQFLNKSVDKELLYLENPAVPNDKLLFIIGHMSGNPAPVIAWEKGSVTTNATISTTSQITTLVGILTKAVTILGMISTCSQLPIRKTTFPYFHFWSQLPDMIPTAFCPHTAVSPGSQCQRTPAGFYP